MPELTGGDERFRADGGTADPAVTNALAAFAAGTGGEHAALVALADSRLLVPVVPVLADELTEGDGHPAGTKGQHAGRGGGEKASEMALPKIVARDGRSALPVFTCLETVQRWRPEARPVPVGATGVWQSAVQESCAVVIDIAGPVPFVVEGSRLLALAGGTVPAMHEDLDVWRQVAAAAAELASGIRVKLTEPHGGVDFTLELAPPAGGTGLVPEDLATRIAEAVHDRLPGRIRAGIAVVRRPG
jgi:hypothetical protein